MTSFNPNNNVFDNDKPCMTDDGQYLILSNWTN